MKELTDKEKVERWEKQKKKDREWYKNNKGYYRNYYQKHKVKIAAVSKEYYQNHKEEFLRRQRIYCKEHAEEIKAKNKIYYQKNKEKLNAYNKKWLQKRRDILAEAKRIIEAEAYRKEKLEKFPPEDDV